MPFSDYFTTPASNTSIGASIYVGPNMARDDVREALQTLAADGRELSDELTSEVTRLEDDWAGSIDLVALTTASIEKTKADATAALAGMTEGAYVNVLNDESRSGGRSLYQKTSGALVFVVDLTFTTVTVTASASGSAPNVGRKVIMPTSGTGQDIGVLVEGGTGLGSGVMAVFEKNRTGGQDFFRFLTYDAAGNYYHDDGTDPHPNVIAMRVGSAGQIETRMWMIISGTVNKNGTPGDPMDPTHAVDFEPPSRAPMMLGIWADLDIAMSTRLPDFDPQREYQVHWSVIGNDGGERLAWKKQGNIAYMDNWVPDAANMADRPDHVDFEVGRVGKLGFGAQASGFMCLNTCTLADLTRGIPDAVDLYQVGANGLTTAGAVIVTDAGTPGLYYSNGRVFALSTNAATTVGPDPFGWTTATALNAGETIGETSLKNFEKTGGTPSWNSSVYTTATHTGDQLAAFVVDDAAGLYVVGLGTAIPSGAGDDYYKSAQGNMTGVFVSGGIYFACVAGVIDSATQLRNAKAGDVVVIRKIGATVTLEVNGDLVHTLTTAAPSVAYYGMAALRTVNTTIASMRWRVLS